MRFRCPKTYRQKPPKSKKCVKYTSKTLDKYKMSTYKSVRDFDFEYDEDCFDPVWEAYYESSNPSSGYVHANGMLWDKKENYIGKFVNGKFVKGKKI